MVKDVLFVCTGNICRSPMAEAFFNALAERRGLPVRARSAGLSPVLDRVTEVAARVAGEYGVDLRGHRSRPLHRADVAQADLILTMTEGQRRLIEELFPEARDKTFTLLAYVGERGDIADPYGESLAVYRRCAERIWNGVERVIASLGGETESARPVTPR
ncbi:MAG: low molecular weight protein arginine phosphatase [Acidobacteria bacterium]|nr:MAG: low molecular weight protein arginine phosphatase [Acidobacteriota bacterium]